MPSDPATRAQALLALHHADTPLVLPNAWDVASAVAVERAGFPVVATTSGGLAESLGFADHQQTPPEEMFRAIRRIAAAVEVPVTADVEAGYGLPPEELVARLLETGAVGCNLEDTDHEAGALADALGQASFLAAVRDAADRAGVHLVINARIDVFLHGDASGETRVQEAIRRGRLYRRAGADGVYPIFARGRSALRELVRACDCPLNAMRTPGGLGVAELADLGIRRISYGSGLFRAGERALPQALAEIREQAGYST